MHGQFLRETEGMQDQRRWQWLKAGELKWGTESLICAAQELALRTNAIKNGIDTKTCPRYAGSSNRKLKVSPYCQFCQSVLAGNQHRKRHDKLGKKVLWLLCKKFEIECEDKLFSHQPEPRK